MRRPGSAPASISAIRRASHSREAEFVSLMTSLASTGMATGRRTAGSRTTTAAITQLFPYPVFAGPGADPSWNQEAAQTFLPRRRNKVSSIATTTGSPAGTSSATTRRATARPRSSGFQRARAKNRCARSCGQIRDKPAPASIPHTVRFPAWDKNPQARPQNVRNDGAVNNGPNTASRLASEAGTGSVASGSISGNPRFISGFYPGSTSARPPPPRGSARPQPSWTACQKHPVRRPGPPSPCGSSPTSRAAGPASASPSCATADDSATYLPACPATANPPRSCGCATRDQPTAGPSGSTWPAAASTPSPNCPPPSDPRPARPKKGSMTPSSSTRAPKPATNGPQPAPGPRPRKCETRDIKDRFENCGHQMHYSKNWWTNPEYKGINTRWATPEGQRFEVQF